MTSMNVGSVPKSLQPYSEIATVVEDVFASLGVYTGNCALVFLGDCICEPTVAVGLNKKRRHKILYVFGIGDS